jgi:hypothetical protein
VAGQLVVSNLGTAAGLRVVAEASGCDRIEVERRGQPPVTVVVSR